MNRREVAEQMVRRVINTARLVSDLPPLTSDLSGEVVLLPLDPLADAIEAALRERDERAARIAREIQTEPIYDAGEIESTVRTAIAAAILNEDDESV